MQYKSDQLRTTSKVRFWSPILWVLFALLMGSAVVIPSSAQEAAPVGPPQVGIRPDAPPYALHGPYWVGTQSFVGEDVD